MNKFFAGLLLLPCLGWGQLIKLDSLEHLGDKASETIRFSLDGPLLQLAAKFLSSDDDDSDIAEVKKVVTSLRSLHVRSYEFKNTGEYLDADLEPLRVQVRDPSWSRVVEVHSKAEGDSDVYIKTDSSKVGGLVVISAEPKQLTVVVLEGSIDVEGLSKLAGNFGIPKPVRKKIEEKMDKEKVK